jgi:hypothetical protein
MNIVERCSPADRHLKWLRPNVSSASRIYVDVRTQPEHIIPVAFAYLSEPISADLSFVPATQFAKDTPESDARAHQVVGDPPLIVTDKLRGDMNGENHVVQYMNSAGRGIPSKVAAELAEPEAKDAATKLSAATAIQALRNALAHGSIVYLDKDGSGLYGSRAEMIAFISERRNQGGEVVGYHVLRISEDGFRSFLHRSVDWLNDTDLLQALAA